jgi:hypothetical protein
VQPDIQYGAVAGRGRCGTLHQLCNLAGRQAAEDGDSAIVYSVAWTGRTAGINAVAELLRPGRGCCNSSCSQQNEKCASQTEAPLPPIPAGDGDFAA